jgi:hypothetical protein
MQAVIPDCLAGRMKWGQERDRLHAHFEAWMRSVVQSAISLFNKLRGTASTPRFFARRAARVTRGRALSRQFGMPSW